MNLYLVVAYHDGTGDNLDMVVSATTPEQAAKLWAEYWPGDEGEGSFPGSLGTIEKIFLLPSSPAGEAVAHEWPDNLWPSTE